MNKSKKNLLLFAICPLCHIPFFDIKYPLKKQYPQQMMQMKQFVRYVERDIVETINVNVIIK